MARAALALAALLAGKDLLGLPKAPPPPPPRDGCPADAHVEVNLGAWRASLADADANARRRDDLLAQVKLALEPDGDDGDAPAPPLKLAGVEDTVVQLEAGARADHVLHVRYRAPGEGDDAPAIHLVQVLRPLEGRVSCALGAGLSRRDEPARKLVAYTLRFVPLLGAKEKAVELEATFAEARDSETRREYWTPRGLKLRKIFDEATGHMRSGEAGGTTTTVGTLTLTGDFPKSIDLSEVTRRGGCEVKAGNAPCDDGGTPTKTTFVYDGTRYVKKK